MLLPIDYVLSKRRIRRQKIWERRATKRIRKERVAAFNMIAIKHAGNLTRPPLVLMQATDISLNPLRERFDPYSDNAQENTAENDEYQTKATASEINEETEIHHESDFIENGIIEGPIANPGTLPPLESKPSKRKKKKKKRRVTPQSSVDADNGGFVNAGFNNSNSNLNHCVPEQYTNGPYATEPHAERSVQKHYADIHQENDYQTELNTIPSLNHHQDACATVLDTSGQHDSIAIQVGYNNLGKLATDV